jgi:hypothetical protein
VHAGFVAAFPAVDRAYSRATILAECRAILILATAIATEDHVNFPHYFLEHILLKHLLKLPRS